MTDEMTQTTPDSTTPDSQNQTTQTTTPDQGGFTSGGFQDNRTPNAQPPVVDYARLIPQQYRDTELAQSILKTADPVATLYEKHVSLEKMMGNRPAIPGPDAPPEQVAAYYKAIGVPDDVSGYTYEPLVAQNDVDKPVVDYMNQTREGPVMDYMKQVAKQHGLTPNQFKAIVGGYEAALMQTNRDQIMAQFQATQEKQQKFTEIGNTYYGPQKFAEMTSRADSLIQECAGPQALPILARLDAEAHAGIAMLLDGITKKYISEDRFRGNTANAYSGGMNHEQLREQRRTLMAHPAYGDHSHLEHLRVSNQVKQLDEMEKTLLASQGR